MDCNNLFKAIMCLTIADAITLTMGNSESKVPLQGSGMYI